MSQEETALAVAEREAAGVAALEHVLGTGDLAQLTNQERVGHYLRLCRTLGLNPLSRPFDWIEFEDGRLTLYPNQSCAAQLRRQHHIRVEVVRRETVGEMFCVEVKATTPDGREDFASKYVPLTNQRGRLTGQWYANALMKAETGAKRRVTFSMVGLAVPADPDDGPGWRPVVVDGTGMIVQQPTAEQRYLAETPTAAKAIGEPVFEDQPPAEDDEPSQAARAEELEQRRRPLEHQSFRATVDEIKLWQGAWFAVVKGSSLDDDEARHRYVEQYTAAEGWPESKRTASLSTMFARMTAREAGDFLQHVRALVEDEQRANAEALAGLRGEPDDGSTEAF